MTGLHIRNMAAMKSDKAIKIILPAGARKPTQDDIKAAKQYIIDRSDAADEAQYVAGVSIQEAAEKLVEIAYRYDIPVSRFAFDSEVNEDMMGEVSEVMDDLEESLMEDVQDAALSCTKDNNRYIALLAILLSLGHRNMSLRDTVHAYTWRVLRQAEALIASMKASNLTKTEARTKIKTAIQHVNVNSEFQTALKHPLDFAAPYIRNGGKATFPDGTPNVQGVPVNGYDAIKTIFGIAVAQIWMRNQLMDFKDSNVIIGFYQLRGSLLPCSVCDEAAHYYRISDVSDEDPTKQGDIVHCNCMCYRVPIFKADVATKEELAENRAVIREEKSRIISEKYEHGDFHLSATLSSNAFDEWLNQPNTHMVAKNNLLLNLKEVFHDSTYLGWGWDEKGNGIKTHLFELSLEGTPNWIIVREIPNGDVRIHSISENPMIIYYVLRKRKGN